MYHIEFKSRFDGRWYRCRDFFLFRIEAEESLSLKMRMHPETEFRIS